MSKKHSIRLGRGLDEISFGMSKDDLENILGEPEVIDSFTNDPPDQGESHIWHYDDTNLSFTFEEVDNFRLGVISVNSDKFSIRDLIRVGMTKQQVLDTLEELNMTEYAEEDHSTIDNPDHSLVAVDEKSLYLWFDDNQLTEIQWFPFYDEDEEVIWPVAP